MSLLKWSLCIALKTARGGDHRELDGNVFPLTSLMSGYPQGVRVSPEVVARATQECLPCEDVDHGIAKAVVAASNQPGAQARDCVHSTIQGSTLMPQSGQVYSGVAKIVTSHPHATRLDLYSADVNCRHVL